jgi:hypothetical protein
MPVTIACTTAGTSVALRTSSVLKAFCLAVGPTVCRGPAVRGRQHDCVVRLALTYQLQRHGRRMAGSRPAIHVFAARDNKDVDGRAKPSHDDIGRDHRDLVTRSH